MRMRVEKDLSLSEPFWLSWVLLKKIQRMVKHAQTWSYQKVPGILTVTYPHDSVQGRVLSAALRKAGVDRQAGRSVTNHCHLFSNPAYFALPYVHSERNDGEDSWIIQPLNHTSKGAQTRALQTKIFGTKQSNWRWQTSSMLSVASQVYQYRTVSDVAVAAIMDTESLAVSKRVYKKVIDKN